MVMQANILYSPASGAAPATGGGSMETNGGNSPRAFVPVIIPTYRRPDVLPRAISSALRQTLKPAQILVMDDGTGEHSSIWRAIMDAYPPIAIAHSSKQNA